MAAESLVYQAIVTDPDERSLGVFDFLHVVGALRIRAVSTEARGDYKASGIILI